MHLSPRAHILCASLLLTAASSLQAQTPLYSFGSGNQGDSFGDAVDNAGDVNRDGYDDVIIGSPGFDGRAGSRCGGARVMSGLDGSILYQWEGEASEDFFGIAVAGAGDVNGDNYADLIVGAWHADFNGLDSGRAYVYSGRTGQLIYSMDGDAIGDGLGFAVDGAGDVNGDSLDDVVVGARNDDTGGSQAGMVRIYNGRNGAVLNSTYGNAIDRYGAAVAGIGDVDGDQLADVIVGAWSGANSFTGERPGYIRVIKGVNGAPIRTVYGDSDNDYFGYSVDGPGDVDGDSIPDLLVGAPYDDNVANNCGSARVISGLNGAIIHLWDGNSSSDLFGFSVHGAGDINGDLHQDLIVGAYLETTTENGAAWVYSGQDGTQLQLVEGDSQGDYLGKAVSGGGDVNGDGVPDFIVGAPASPTTLIGEVIVFSGLDCQASWSNYGVGWPGTHGVPSFTASGDPVLCGQIDLMIENSAGVTTAGVLFIGLGIGALPTPLGGLILVSSPWTLIPMTLPGGGLTLSIPVVCDTAFCGVSVYLQVLEVDAGASRGVSFTRGLELLHGY